jgi:hypothetical protein
MKETLEDFRKKYIAEINCELYSEQINDTIRAFCSDAIEETAKWHAERMYSEEEVLDILLKFDNFKEVHHAKGKLILDYETRMKWFEQFKNKQ